MIGGGGGHRRKQPFYTEMCPLSLNKKHDSFLELRTVLGLFHISEGIFARSFWEGIFPIPQTPLDGSKLGLIMEIIV